MVQQTIPEPAGSTRSRFHEEALVMRAHCIFARIMLVGAILVAGQALSATTDYDLTTDWSDVQNPFGAWVRIPTEFGH
jgi:hypothetical protein